MEREKGAHLCMSHACACTADPMHTASHHICPRWPAGLWHHSTSTLCARAWHVATSMGDMHRNVARSACGPYVVRSSVHVDHATTSLLHAHAHDMPHTEFERTFPTLHADMWRSTLPCHSAHVMSCRGQMCSCVRAS